MERSAGAFQKITTPDHLDVMDKFRVKKSSFSEMPVPWWVDLSLAVISIPVAVTLFDLAVVRGMDQLGSALSEALNVPVDFNFLLSDLKEVVALCLILLWVNIFLKIRLVAKRFLVSLFRYP